MRNLLAKKNIVLLGGIAVLIVVLGILLVTLEKKDASDANGLNVESPGSNFSERNPNLSNRENAIQYALARPSELPKSEIHGATYILTGYDETAYLDDSHDNKPGRKFGGILVFKIVDGEPELFWESEEYINRLYVRYQDLDADGIPEIVWDGDLGATGRSNAYYVYKFADEHFKLITPVELKGSTLKYGRTLLSGEPEYSSIQDIDNDGVMEIIVGYSNQAGSIVKRTYKFDGEQYVLWAESEE